jgi:hypothetical protein
MYSFPTTGRRNKPREQVATQLPVVWSWGIFNFRLTCNIKISQCRVYGYGLTAIPFSFPIITIMAEVMQATGIRHML